MKKVYIFTFGCANRYLEAEKYKLFLEKNNYTLTNQPAEADFVIINTCAFRKSEEDTSIDKIKEMQKRIKPGGKIIVGGCLPGINKKRLEEIFTGDTFTPQTIDKINKIFSARHKIENLQESNTYQPKKAKTFNEILQTFGKISKTDLIKKTIKYTKAKLTDKKIQERMEKRFHIKIGTGCMGNCSYCGIKNAIGNLKSKSIDSILEEFKKGINENYTTVILTSDDCGAYGLDIGSDLPHLLLEMKKINNKINLEINEINVQWLIKYQKELTNIFKEGQFKHMWVAIQSGSNKILEKMRRQTYGGIANVIKTMREIKAAIPKLNIKAQYIVGFPGEDGNDVEATVTSIIESKIDEVNLFKFDPKPDTDASTLPGQIPSSTIDKRIKEMKKQLKIRNIKVFTNN